MYHNGLTDDSSKHAESDGTSSDCGNDFDSNNSGANTPVVGRF
jgi:hypothetical protein